MLSRRGVRFTTRDLFKQPLTVEELRRLAAIAPNGLRGLLSTRSAQYRALGLDRPGVTDEALVVAMAREPRLVRRPLVLAGDRLVVGFDRSAMEAFG